MGKINKLKNKQKINRPFFLIFLIYSNFKNSINFSIKEREKKKDKKSQKFE